MGYVGLPLAISFSKKYPTIGFDISKNRIDDLSNNNDRTLEVDNKTLAKSNLSFTNDLGKISNCNTYIITVPTPVDKYNVPDMEHLKDASQLIGKVLEKNNIVIYESTVYPGATEEYCIPILEKFSNLIHNKDFFSGYSPERINPGDKDKTLTKITKITSGSNEKIAEFVDLLYSSIIEAGTFKASSIRVAEAAKVIENVQRDVNIALINEIALICDKLNINTKEVLDAAKTKWNFLPFKPGLVGGHCIGVDPYYLTYKAIEIGYQPEIILAGRRINDGMAKFIVQKTLSMMINNDINPNGAKVGILGLTFKENCPDLRNTKVIDIIKGFKSVGSEVYQHDPYVDDLELKTKFDLELTPLKNFSNFDAIILAVNHKEYLVDIDQLLTNMIKDRGIIIDIKSSIDQNSILSNKNLTIWQL